MVASPLTLTVDLTMEPSEHVIYEGVLGDIPIGQLKSGASYEVETAISFLTYGRFDIGAEVRIAGVPRHERSAGKGELKAVIKETT